MKRHSITNAQLKAFSQFKNRFSIPRLPSKQSWRKASDDDIWIKIVSQVVVVGNARPENRLREPEIRSRIKWQYLVKLPRAKAKKSVWSVLREIKARYAGKSVSSCRKTKALMTNLDALLSHKGGPKGFLRQVATLRGSSADRVKYVSEHLSYIKYKGARDFLTTGFGLAQDVIALDSRILSVLKGVGINIPRDVQTNPRTYAQFEAFLLKEVCKPLGLTGAKLDQLLFKNYNEIKKLI